MLRSVTSFRFRERKKDMTPQIRVLNSWKEIAAYLDRGVRTAQRWEHDLHMPIHRPKGQERSAVIAFPEELDNWLHAAPVRFGHSVDSLAEVTKALDIVSRSKRLGATANELLVRARELAQKQTTDASTMCERVRLLKQKCAARRHSAA
ncbi:MAG: hypothetical protein ACR2IF_06640 [Terriglobales bacterium]